MGGSQAVIRTCQTAKFLVWEHGTRYNQVGCLTGHERIKQKRLNLLKCKYFAAGDQPGKIRMALRQRDAC